MDLPRERTFQSMLVNSVSMYPHRTALSTVDGDFYTYAQLARKVQDISQLLYSQGIEPGDRVAILSENKPQWTIAYLAIVTSGAIAVPILPDFHEREIQQIIQHSESKALFVSRKLMPKIQDLSETHAGATILIESFAVLPAHVSASDAAAQEDAAPVPVAPLTTPMQFRHAVHNDDLAAVVYTSGTTGFSKGVMLSHSNILSDAIATTQIVDINCNDRMLSILPLAHTYECTVGMVIPLLIGASVYYMDRPPSAPVLLPAMVKVKPTIMLSVPLIIEKIYKAKIQPKFSGSPVFRLLNRHTWTRKPLARIAGRKLLRTFGGELKLFAIGGAPLAADVEAFLRDAQFPFGIGYGLTETSPLIAGSAPALTRYRSTGKPLPGTEIKILNPDPNTGEGEILVKGPTVMKGYFRDPDRTADVMTGDGWFKTGDLGAFDTDGYLYIKGRLKNMILGPSGKNIYPEEIESAINESDLVLESLVFEHQNKLIARAHLNYEELIKKFSLHNLNEHQIREHVRTFLEDLRRQVNDRLASFSRLHSIIEQSEPFEKTPTQKIKRHLYATLSSRK